MLEEFRLKEYPTVELYKIPNFLTEGECNQLIALIDGNLQRSTTTGPKGEYAIASDFRTSSTSVLPVNNDVVIDVDFKIRSILNTDDFGESIEGQKYEVGQQFKNHKDFFEGESLEKHFTSKGIGNRSWTFMIYLNNVPVGGETEFSKLGVKFKAKRGTAIIWKNTEVDGTLYHDTLHSGNPVISGEKYIITKWFKHLPIGHSLFKCPSTLGKFTPKGYGVFDVPDSVWDVIQYTYSKLLPKIKKEEGASIQGDSEIMSMDEIPELRNFIHESLKKSHEDWSGVELIPTACYGIRSYKRGSKLPLHLDRLETHHISSIILVDSKEDRPWPLVLVDNSNTKKYIYLKPKQMILYESATCLHGRPEPFIGDYFRNFFSHYRVKSKKYAGS